jgi:rod shape-determining protein MreC
MSKRPYYVAFSIVLLVVLGALNLPERRAAQAKLVWGSLFMPLFGLAGSAQNLARLTAQAVLPRSVLLRQVETLGRENQELRFQIVQLQTAREENQRLRQALAWQQRTPWQMKLARVIAHDPANWWRTVWIDLGTRDGVRTNLPVVTAEGLVGRVAQVGYTRAEVLLAGDPNCRFSAQVQETRDKGIIAPNDSSFNRQFVDFTFVPTGVTLKPGQTVVTSGDGGVFPKGLTVGQIVDVQTNEYGIFLEARVRLAANLNRLEEVWVLLR